MLKRGFAREALGKVVLGTARGDIHDIGKNLVATILSASGFQIFDLGTSVTPEQFVAKIKEVDADIVGVSALLTTTMAGQKAVIEALDRSGLRPRVKAIIGGAAVTSKWASEIGADGYSRNAIDALELAKNLMGKGTRRLGMRPRIQLLSPELVGRILCEAFELLMNPGVRVGSAVVELLRAAGVVVNDDVACIPEPLVRNCLASAPRDFYLYNRQGEQAVHYGGDDVHFDPGSCCVQMLDPETLEARPSETRDLVRLVQVTEMLPQFAAQSTAVVCSDASPARSAISIGCSSSCSILQAGGDRIVLRSRTAGNDRPARRRQRQSRQFAKEAAGGF